MDQPSPEQMATPVQYNPFIRIGGASDFQARVTNDLDTFLATPTGQRWFDAYVGTGRYIMISPSSSDQFGPSFAAAAVGNPGHGFDSNIYLNSRTNIYGMDYTGTDGRQYHAPGIGLLNVERG